MSEEKLICGKTHEQIRKAYFGKKLGKFLDDAQSKKEITKDDMSVLTLFLEGLRQQEIDNADELIEKFGEDAFGGDIITSTVKPPTVEDLAGGLSDEEWRGKADAVTKSVKHLLSETYRRMKDREQISPSYWLDAAITINTNQEVLDKDRVYKDQLYRKRMTEFIDNFDCSRAEAQERAKLTTEYRDYKEAYLLEERLAEFINLCKKKDSR